MAITTHVLDIARGKPAAGITVTLSVRGSGGAWSEVGKGVTEDDGRCKSLLSGKHAEPGLYRLNFDVGAYHEANRVEGFFPDIAVHFIVREPGQKFHVPLLVSPFGYSTYRGS